MDSVPATSDGQAPPATLPRTRLIRAASVVRTPRRDLRTGHPGQLAGRIGDFGVRLGLSHTSRWALDAQRLRASDSSVPVRPPLSYWPWADPDESSVTPELP